MPLTWFRPLSEPIYPLFDPNLMGVTGVFQTHTPILTTTRESWFQPLSEPFFPIPALHASMHPAYFPDTKICQPPWDEEVEVSGTWSEEQALC